MEGIPNLWKGLCQSVLILIIMEDTHGGSKTVPKRGWAKVLILIIMEDTHGAFALSPIIIGLLVLILIIMEDTHGESRHISP